MSDKRYAVKLTPKAREDLDSIYRYIGEELCNPSAAANLSDQFEKAFDRISVFPFSCPSGKTEPDYRKLEYEKYL